MSQPFELRSSLFRREREASWLELERLVARIEQSGARSLGPDETVRLPELYRGAVSSLSVARAISLDRNLLDYLENLCGRAYVAVYGAKRPALQAVRSFLLRGFPRAVRRNWAHLLTSTALLGLGVLGGYLLTVSDEERYYGLVPPAMAQGRDPGASREDLRRVLYHGAPSVGDPQPTPTDEGDEEDEERERASRLSVSLNLFASFLFTNNAKVGILCFALGFAAGAPVVLLLFHNGLMLGAMAGLYANRGLGGEFWAWVLPHGVTELGAVALCGAAGLVLGTSLVFPGRHRRLANLARRGREAAMIVIGAVLLFFVAALIEGFFRQLVHDLTARWSMALVTLAVWLGYFGLFGREREVGGDR